jgi:hypothetical protein
MAKTDTDDILDSIGSEIKSNPPAILAKTSQKFGPGRAQKQRVAILLSKARKSGASIPQPKGFKS